MKSISRNAIIAIAIACAVGCAGGASWAQTQVTTGSLEDKSCLNCHASETISPVSARGKTLNLRVDTAVLGKSSHRGLACIDCHGGAETFWAAPHNSGQPLTYKCASCHGDVQAKYEKSVHGMWHDRGDPLAATCVSCHGGHDILPSTNPDSRTSKFHLHETCGACHQNPALLKERAIREPMAVGHFMDSIHGRALFTKGLVVAPTCNDCHGSHEILPKDNPESKVGRAEIPKTCGKCHVLVEKIYDQSIHGKLAKSHDVRAPVCNTCHTSHEIDTTTAPEFHLKSDRMCGQCHMDRLRNYRDTFHGKALALGREGVAACYDCHGHHEIRKSEDPASWIHKSKRIEVCRKCHPNANENFAGYIVHADHTDKRNHPFLYYTFWLMTALLIGTFAFFAVHTILWLFRSTKLYTSDSKDFRLTKWRIREDEEQYVRFKPLDRFLHGLVIFSFLLCVITGMPLKFFYTDWAKWLFHMMGGQAAAARLHRLGALITIFYFCVHVVNVIWHYFRRLRHFRNPRTGKFSLIKAIQYVIGPNSPMPNLQDLKDMVNHNRWFLGLGGKPQFDRWTYWEKFDYLAVFWGVAIIGTSGLVMWFPTVFTSILPGWVINVALIIHSDEALLAAGFIFTFHFFNVHFRPEKFPMDPVIFSGRISKSELLHERRRLFERWESTGELDEHKVRLDEWQSWKWIAMPAGFIAFLIGVVLVILIFWAMIGRLTG